jgi:hypothetical protein
VHVHLRWGRRYSSVKWASSRGRCSHSALTAGDAAESRAAAGRLASDILQRHSDNDQTNVRVNARNFRTAKYKSKYSLNII